MIRIFLVLALAVVLASCSDARDISEFNVSIAPTGSGFACQVDGDAPDEWVVLGSGPDGEGAIAFDHVSDSRIEFNPFNQGFERVSCTARYPEGERSASLRLRNP